MSRTPNKNKPAKKKDSKFWLRVGCGIFAAVMLLSVFLTLIVQLVYMV